MPSCGLCIFSIIRHGWYGICHERASIVSIQREGNRKATVAMRFHTGIFVVLAFGAIGLGCAGSSAQVRDQPAQRARPVDTRYGVASWYGREFHGRQTASGESYNMHAYTAAHRTLPFGTLVRVTNLRNGRQTLVRINDRGPFKRNREIDLSYRAACDLDILEAGLEKVRLEIFSG